MPDLSPFLDPAKATAQAAVDAADRERDAALMAMDERRAQAERRAAGAESELAVLKANPPHDIIPWVPGMQQEAGKTYGVAGQVSVVVTANHTRWVGLPLDGGVQTGQAFCLHVRAPNVVIDGLAFGSGTNFPATGRIGVKPCIRIAAPDCVVSNCITGPVDTFVEVMPGADNATITHCTAIAGLRASFVYAAGAKNVVLDHLVVPDSATENVVRFSPELGQVCENVVVTNCDLGNPGNKAALDCRHVAGVTVAYNTFRHNGGMAVRLGDSDLPGCSGLVFHENDIFNGFVHAKALSAGLLFNNRFHGLDAEKTYPLQFDPASKVDAFSNVGYVAALSGKERAWSGRDNRWEVKS